MPEQQRVNRLLFLVEIGLRHEQRRHSLFRALPGPQKIESGGQRADAGCKDDAQKADGPRLSLFGRFFRARRGNALPRFRRGRARLFAFRFRKRDALRDRPLHARPSVRRFFLGGAGRTADPPGLRRRAVLVQIRQFERTPQPRTDGPFELSASGRRRRVGSIPRRRARLHALFRCRRKRRRSGRTLSLRPFACLRC